MTNQQPTGDVSTRPEEMKAALQALGEEMTTYKKQITAGELSLNNEAVQRLKEAADDLRNQHQATIDDVEYHTERLKVIRKKLSGSKEEE